MGTIQTSPLAVGCWSDQALSPRPRPGPEQDVVGSNTDPTARVLLLPLSRWSEYVRSGLRRPRANRAGPGSAPVGRAQSGNNDSDGWTTAREPMAGAVCHGSRRRSRKRGVDTHIIWNGTAIVRTGAYRRLPDRALERSIWKCSNVATSSTYAGDSSFAFAHTGGTENNRWSIG